MPPLSDQDLIALNSYLDGRLSANERAALETRLAGDAALRAELESLRVTIGLLRMAERVPVPRSFTLDPATYSGPSPGSLWDRLGLGSLPGWVFAGASLAVALACIGAVILSGGLAGAPAASVAFQSAPQSGERAALPASGQATGAPVRQSVAAPTEAAVESATQAPVEAAAQAAASAAEPTSAPGPALAAPAAPPQALAPVASSPGQAGASDQAGGAGAAIPSPMPQPTQGLESAAQPAPPAETTASPAAKSSTGGGLVANQANAAPTEVQAGVRNFAGAAPSETPAGSIGAAEAQPFQGLKPAGWILLAGGTFGLLALVLVATALTRRRR